MPAGEDESIKIADGQVELSNDYSTHRFLYAFSPQAEVRQLVRTQAIESDALRLPTILASWSAVQLRVAALVVSEAGIPDTIAVSGVPDVHTELVAGYLSDPLLQKTFSGIPFEVAFVEVDKLVAGQQSLNLEYVDRLGGIYSKDLSPEALLAATVSPRREMDPIRHLEVAPNTHVFSSPNTDVRFLGAFLKSPLSESDAMSAEMGGVPVAALIAFVGYGGAPVNAFRIGSRVVLNNGFHRVFALRKLGCLEIPLILQNVANPQVELPPQIAGRPTDYLVQHPRPPMIKDFLNDDLNVELHFRRRMRMIQVGVGVSPLDVPV
jgi:hypothetical protein